MEQELCDCSSGLMELRCAPLVEMMKTADFRDLYHRSPIRWLHRSRIRCVLGQRQVLPGSVAAVNVAARNSSQVRFAENDDVIEALASQGADYPLSVWILPGDVRGKDNFLDVRRLDSVPKCQAVHTTPVSGQVTRRPPSPTVSIICCALHSAVGCSVTSRSKSRFLPEISLIAVTFVTAPIPAVTRSVVSGAGWMRGPVCAAGSTWG